jgi:hypothetical protein
MDSLKSHDRLLLGPDKNWDVADVTLDVSLKSVTISLEYRGKEVCARNLERYAD